jgi:hypothetical protein
MGPFPSPCGTGDCKECYPCYQKYVSAKMAGEIFEPLPPDELDRLIEKGARDARELDRAIRDQFEPGPEAGLVLR